MSILNNSAVSLAKAFKSQSGDKPLTFTQFTMQHSDRYAQGRSSHPCGCYWCQSQDKLNDLQPSDSETKKRPSKAQSSPS